MYTKASPTTSTTRSRLLVGLAALFLSGTLVACGDEPAAEIGDPDPAVVTPAPAAPHDGLADTRNCTRSALAARAERRTLCAR